MGKYDELDKKLRELNYDIISDDEIMQIAKNENKNVQEVIQNIKFALSDLEYTTKEIDSIISKNNYKRFPNNDCLFEYGKNNELNVKYLCSNNLNLMNRLDKKDIAIVTGFGPTNSPTAGTLSMIFRAIEMQKKTGIYTHIILSDLGAFNSRQKPLEELINRGKQFKRFIEKLGFDINNGIIRTHNDYDHARVFALCSSVLTINDFVNHDEATADMYKRLNIQGNDFSTMVDQTFTVADILLPILRDGKKGVIVSAGLEENYYPQLANIVIERLLAKKGSIRELISDDAVVGALYGKLIKGLFPYVKMSKSIPSSAINIGDSEEEIKNKILNCSSRNEEIILQMMQLASNWDSIKVQKAIESFNDREKKPTQWFSYKEEYCKFFLNMKKMWDDSYQKEENIKNEIFF